MINKRAEEGSWTVRKVVMLILLVILLILIIFGLISGKINPLFENVKGRMNSVLILLGVSSEGLGGSFDCFSRKLSEVSGGGEILESFDVNEGVFLVCRDGNCYVELGEDKFSFNRKTGRVVNENNKNVIYDLEKDFSLVEWEIYNLFLDDLKKALNINFDSEMETKIEEYFKGYTKSFTLYGDGGWFGSSIYATWQDDQWRVSKRGKEFKILYDGKSDSEAMDVFYNEVHGGYFLGYNVYYQIDFPKKHGESYIGTLIEESKNSISEIIGNGKLSSKDDLNKLLAWWNTKKRELILESIPNEEKIKKFKELIVGREIDLTKEKIKVSGVDYDDISHPIIYFSDLEGKVYGLKYVGYNTEFSSGDSVRILVKPSQSSDPVLKYDEEGNIKQEYYSDVKLRISPFVLVYKTNRGFVEVQDLINYRIPEKYLDSLIKQDLLLDFFKKNCK
jgi:hypothetical protein